MKSINGLNLHDDLYDFIENICIERDLNVSTVLCNLVKILKEFGPLNEQLLNERKTIQQAIDLEFDNNPDLTASQLAGKLKQLGVDYHYIHDLDTATIESDIIEALCHAGVDIAVTHKPVTTVTTKDLPEEITKLAGPQLVVPADKANMVLNAANARWVSLKHALNVSNIINPEFTGKDRQDAIQEYLLVLLDEIVPLDHLEKWSNISKVTYDSGFAVLVLCLNKIIREGYVTRKNTNIINNRKIIGVNLDEEAYVSDFIIENNGLKLEVLLDKGTVKDINIESALTYIVDLEDASISAPENKIQSYNNIKSLLENSLTCEVRGETRRLNIDTEYFDTRYGQATTSYLKRTGVMLVREVGPHMMTDTSLINLDGMPVSEKIVDLFVTSLIGARLHVAPKMHGEQEVTYMVALLDKINHKQGLLKNSNKIGIMNEEVRTTLQLKESIKAAHEILFFTNTGFLDYTGSFIDMMMHKGAIAPYKDLPKELYKSSYETNNVNISLSKNVPQVGAGMWASINDMAGLFNSKVSQIKGLTDTSWSPSPNAAAIHALAFHSLPPVRTEQNNNKRNDWSDIRHLLYFPRANNLTQEEIQENLDLAVHGLLAYAGPWIQKGIGCSGIKDLTGEMLMEDRATARIKAAFLRNWLLHKVITESQVLDSIDRMSILVDEQNQGVPYYIEINGGTKYSDVEWAVKELIMNPLKRTDSYIEPYFYPAFAKKVKPTKKKKSKKNV